MSRFEHALAAPVKYQPPKMIAKNDERAGDLGAMWGELLTSIIVPKVAVVAEPILARGRKDGREGSAAMNASRIRLSRVHMTLPGGPAPPMFSLGFFLGER